MFKSITAFTPWVQAVVVMFSAEELSQPKPESRVDDMDGERNGPQEPLSAWEKVENSTCASPTQLPPCSLVAD